MKFYSVGFCFTYDLAQVALIRKVKPEWQKGKLNGVGGAVEIGENFQYAMWREWNEETGLPSAADGWNQICEMRGQDYIVAVFTYRMHVIEPDPFKTADEQVAWYMTHSIQRRNDIIPNLRWLIPLCLDESVHFPIQVYNK